ncbi:hemicentin-1-like isoform X2 [Brienomyrus brachyistius]|uniref:hemicentin-1-like isoform X2 n=1 Tax=Brienomyrus brachyistius TaxID=42636 RepID=UPI0020B28259|nr:hemicentin-1-like isoform X2 [Brienomyrus brachyistius]
MNGFRVQSPEKHWYLSAIRVVNGPVSVTEGGSANLSCRLTETDEDLQQVTWQKRTREIPQNHNFLVILPPRDVTHVNGLVNRVRFIGNLTMKTGSIQISNVSLRDEGVYTCIFTVFPSGPHQTETRLTVHVRPVVTVTPAAPLVVGGEIGVLATCIAANGRPAAGVSWRTDQLDGPTEIQNNATQNPNGTTTVRRSLLVTPTRSMNGREVQCVVNHTSLEHDEIVPYRISVHYAPQSVNITLNGRSSEGPVFQCDVDANPAPTRYTWSRVDSEVLGPSLRPEGGRLVFLKRDPGLNGLYVCEASNQYGRVTGTLFVYTDVTRGYYGGLIAVIVVLLSALSLLSFYTWKTSIRVVNGPVSVTEGGSANLSCRLTETDEDLQQVTWRKRTREIPQNHNFLVILPPRDVRHINGLVNRVRFIGNLSMKTGSIQISNVSLQDEGVYTCIFTVFPSGPHQIETQLTVHVRPVVTVTPAAPLVVGGEIGVLATCIAANGRPAAGVSWRTDQLDGPTEIQNNMTQNPNGTTTVRRSLLVTPTRSMNGQEVQCVVTHISLEHDEIMPYRISVHYAPQSVNITLNGTSSEGPVFQCDVDANPAPTRYTWSRVDSEVLGPSLRPEGGRLVFLKRDPGLNGLYVCEASNQYGRVTGTLFVYTDVTRSYYGGLIAVIVVLLSALILLSV